MRRTSLVVVAAAILWAWPGLASAQSSMKERIRIDRVRVGFPSAQPNSDMGGDGRDTPVYKAGFWTPVYVDITAGILGLGMSEAEQKYRFEVVVETTDSDGIANNYIVPLRPLEKKESITVLAYARTGNTN